MRDHTGGHKARDDGPVGHHRPTSGIDSELIPQPVRPGGRVIDEETISLEVGDSPAIRCDFHFFPAHSSPSTPSSLDHNRHYQRAIVSTQFTTQMSALTTPAARGGPAGTPSRSRPRRAGRRARRTGTSSSRRTAPAAPDRPRRPRRPSAGTTRSRTGTLNAATRAALSRVCVTPLHLRPEPGVPHQQVLDRPRTPRSTRTGSRPASTAGRASSISSHQLRRRHPPGRSPPGSAPRSPPSGPAPPAPRRRPSPSSTPPGPPPAPPRRTLAPARSRTAPTPARIGTSSSAIGTSR